MSNALTGINVVVTRPSGQAAHLCQLIEASGGNAITFPCLEIVAPEMPPQLDNLEQYTTAIFISSNAASWASHFINRPLPDTLVLIAVGKQTADAVRRLWQRPVLCPETEANSEALLALPELQKIDGQRILIIRGQGGRELLADTLRQRGATVAYSEVYRRIKPDADLSSLQAADNVDVFTATSNHSLQNLHDMANETSRPWLLSQALIVISQRTAALAQQLGFRQTFIAPEASDQGLINAIVDWRTQTQH